jgi:N-methylhydantoinase B
MQLDAISVKLLWDRLVSITEEASATFKKTCFSPLVRDGNDFATALLDIHGNSLAQASIAIPSFIGTLPITAKHFFKAFPIESLHEGDHLITNDPWLATGHSLDFTIISPVFHNNRLVAFAGTIAHSPDIGGTSGWGCSAALDNYEEGLRVPMMKLYKKGRPNEDLIALIRNNSRLPDETVGDLTAMISANHTTSFRLQELMSENEIDELTPLAQDIQKRSERAMREAIGRFPDGVYEYDFFIDGYPHPMYQALKEKAIHIKARITIADTDITVDFTGSSPQTLAGINSVYNYTYAYTAYPIKCIALPLVANNDGCFKPVTVIAPKGSILNARVPAPTQGRHIVGHVCQAAVFGALAKVLPDKVMGIGSAPQWATSFSGINKKGKLFSSLITANGGTGACPDKDGEICSFPSNIGNIPIEVLEHSLPIRFTRKEIIPDSGGAGRFRGGCGQHVRVEMLEQASWVLSCNRLKHPAQGLLGGLPGAPAKVLLNGIPQTAGMRLVGAGDRIDFIFPGGGGLHPPEQRPSEKVLQDIKDGFVSVEQAKNIYGVTTNP